MTPDDRQLADIVRRIDGPIALDDELEQRLIGRTLTAFDDAVDEMTLDDDDVVDLTETIAFDDAHEVERRPVPSTDRWRAPLLVAASVIAVVGLAAALMLWGRADDPSQIVPANPNPGSVSAPSTLPPSTAVPLPDVGNTLGYLPLAGSTFRFGGDVASSTDRTIIERTGDFDPNRSGALSIDVRRAIEVGRAAGGDIETIRLTVRTDGVVVAPLEYLDPIELGGTCIGGSVPIGPFALTMTTPAICDDQETAVEIVTEVGPTEPIALLAQPIDATPVTFTITPAGDTERRVTLWFAEQGLVRRTHDIGADSRNLDLDLDSLIRMEGTP